MVAAAKSRWCASVADTALPSQRAGAQIKVERGPLDDDSTVPANAGVGAGAGAAAAADAVGCRVAAVAGLFSVAVTSGEEPPGKRRRTAFPEAEVKPESM